LKTRSGFVSNSSTSSFIVIGYEIETSENASTGISMFEKLFSKSQLDAMTQQYTNLDWADADEEEKKESLYEYKWENDDGLYFMLTSDDGLEDENSPVVGIRLLDCDGYEGLPYMKQEFGKMLSDLWKLREKLGIDENIEPSLFAGTRAS